MRSSTDAGAVDPCTQPRPGMEQGFVGDLHLVGSGGDEAPGDKGVKNGLGVALAEQQLAPRHTPPGPGGGGASDVDEAGEDPPGEILLRGSQPGIYLLRAGGDCSVDATAIAVIRDRQPPAAAALPGGQQSVRQQGQGASVVRR